MAKQYLQGVFVPKNPSKYVGAPPIIYRSSWELKFMSWADKNPSVLKWSSEEVIIPYFSKVDNSMHRYFVDFAILVQKKDGSTKRYLIEIKPKIQTVPPVKKKNTNKYIESLATYSVNTSKWAAASAWCNKNNFEFMILTEDHLNV